MVVFYGFKAVKKFQAIADLCLNDSFPVLEFGLSRVSLKRVLKGGKMGTGIWANFHWESGIWVTGTGIWSLGMGITDRKTIELGLGFLTFGKQ